MFELHKASQRGTADYGWLKTNYSFSFSQYYNPARMGFGALRVLNDDVIAPKKGFGTHPHDNMEIITLVTNGVLRHEDNTGASALLRPSDVQVMSAGSGLTHSEFNGGDVPLELFQLWILPSKQNVAPRHEELTYSLKDNEFTVVASGSGKGIPIEQDAAVAVGVCTKEYVHKVSQGCFIMVVEGACRILSQELGRRDAIAVWDEEEIRIEPNGSVKLLCVDVPMR